MNAKRYGLVGLTLIAGVLAMVLLVRLAAATPEEIQDTPFLGAMITGTVATPDGDRVPAGTFVWLREFDPDHLLDYDVDVHGRSYLDLNDQYNFANVPPGRYILRAVPRDIPPFKYAPSPVKIINVFTESLTLPLTLTFPSVTGTLLAPIPPGVFTYSTGIVHVYTQTNAGPIEVERRWVWPQNDGMFVVGGLPTGTFKYQAEPFANDWYWWSNPKVVNAGPFASQYVTLALQSPQVAGVVVQEGTPALPMSEAKVHAFAANGHKVDWTGTLGRFAFADLAPGVVTFTVNPPPGLNWLFPPPHSVTAVVPAGPPPVFVPITLTVPDKKVYGWVRTNEAISQPVQNALVQAYRIGAPGYNSTKTRASGLYTLTLAPGVWAIKISPVTDTAPSDWVYPFEARLVQFDQDRLPERKQLNFRVWVADAKVVGAVELPPRGSGNPPNFTVTVSLHNDEGIGLVQQLDASGRYTFESPHGPYQIDLKVASHLYAAPPPRDINARAVGATFVPTITLIPRNALITGTVTELGSGNPLEGIPVIAWNPDTRASFGARTGPNGVYYLAVYSDTWLVRPAPLPDQPYVYTGEAASVQAYTHQVVNQDFVLTPANATIHGVLVDEQGHPAMDVPGWASARDGLGVRNGAPVVDGFFDILVPDGTYTVSLQVPSGQMYLWDNNPQVASVTSAMSQTVTMTLVDKDARLVGAVWNKRTDKSVGVDVDGRVWGWDSGLWVGTDIKPGNYFTLPVPAGEWRVNYAIDPDSDFVKTVGPRTFAVPSGATVHVPLPVVHKDGVLTGTVVMSDGVTPARGAIVIAEAISADIQEVTLRERVDHTGRFTMTLPHGLYNVRSVLLHNDPRLINPRLTAVNVPQGGSASVTLQYRRADAAITGTLSIAGWTTATGPVYVYAWTADDGYNSVMARANGVYTLPVLMGQAWKIAAVFETPNKYWITRTLVTVPTGTVPVWVNQDLVLAGPKAKPAPVTVMFDAAQDQYVELSDGTRLFIPGGAMPATGRVILHITPIANAVRHRDGEVLGLSYIFEAFTEDGQPITDSFNQDVVIVFKYDPAELMAMGININHVRPAYFSTTTNSWTAPDSFVVDEEHHEITMQIDHFTRFGILGTEAPTQVFLPIVMR